MAVDEVAQSLPTKYLPAPFLPFGVLAFLSFPGADHHPHLRLEVAEAR